MKSYTHTCYSSVSGSPVVLESHKCIVTTAFMSILTIFCLWIVMVMPGFAQGFAQRPDVQAYIADISKKYNFSPDVLAAYLNTVDVKPAIIQAITRPSEKKPWDVYKNIFIKPERVHQGAAFYRKYRTVLEKAEALYGVPAPIIVAILGVETYYGGNQGSYRVIDSLSTLAFDYPARAPFFKKELTEFFLLCRQLNLNPTSVNGSYAGAIGQAQFMPSSYRLYAIDASGENQSDLRHNVDDAIFSIAHYLYKNGWRRDEPIATPAYVPQNINSVVDVKARTPRYTTAQFQSFGITPQYVPPIMPNPVGLIQLEKTNSNEYWIGFPDFYVIMRYNTSQQYAMAVFFLAAEIQREAL